jgi:anti-sigma regulatory factor (Ser/Thr protein kinase)
MASVDPPLYPSRPVEEPLLERAFSLAELGQVRRLAGAAALDSGLSGDRAAELAFAVNEIATNAIVHGSPPAILRIWRRGRELIYEITDAGPGIKDVQAGRRRPAANAIGGRGIWLARRICDRVEIGNRIGCRVNLSAAVPG